MRDYHIYTVFIGVFLAICLCLSIGTVAFGTSDAAANEQLAQFPSFKTENGGFNTNYLSELQDYINDRFFLRQELITVDRKMSNLVGVSGEDSVIAGKDGWLFFGDTVDDYTGANPMSNREVFSAASNVALMEEYCRSLDKKFVFVVAPNKNSLYGQYMPNLGAKNQSSNAKRFHGLLDQFQVPYADLFTAFTQQQEQLYFAHDSHWNSKGAALGADRINEALGVESSYFTGDFSYKVAHDGDLYAMVYPAARDQELDYTYGDILDYKFTSKATQPDAVILNTQGKGEGSLLCYRDSFGMLLFPYLADSYGAAKFSRVVNYDLTAEGDYVVIELAERNLRYLIQNVPVMPAPLRQLELPGTVSGKVQASVDSQARAGKDYVQIKGVLPQTADTTSCVYVVCADRVYEAFCLENNGFAANIPQTEQAQYVVYNIDGQLKMFEIQ